ncbi:hypothetical protein ACEXOS_008140 [Herbiconiux sp. P16]|uniref:hypothetical protein n=1 Tax=Herbiconiux wuyangfengii TaxID=3342794 RepID=UPI0035B6F72E
MTISTRARPIAALLLTAAVAGSVTACTTEYHGYDSGIDGVLWRQIASFEDPLSMSVYDPLDETIGILHTMIPEQYPAAVSDPAVYLAGVVGERWDGTAGSLPELGLEKGGAILYDVTSTESVAAFSTFIASGPRPNAPTDAGSTYTGPSEVYTCYSVEVDFRTDVPPRPIRTAFTECPGELVELLADDAAFASAEVFDG